MLHSPNFTSHRQQIIINIILFISLFFTFISRLLKSPVKAPPEINMDQVEKQLAEKIKHNAKDFIKSFHLFDYNRDGRIQRHDFRKVLDNNAIKLQESQFEK